MVALANLAFLACWLPHVVGMLCLAVTRGSCPWPQDFFAISTNLAMMNSAVNPIIYSMTNRNYRQAFFRFFCRRCKAARAPGPAQAGVVWAGCRPILGQWLYANTAKIRTTKRDGVFIRAESLWYGVSFTPKWQTMLTMWIEKEERNLRG